MAFRPTRYVIEGELDNTKLGVVTGWIQFAGMKGKVVLELQGNFHRDIQGAKIHFTSQVREDGRPVMPWSTCRVFGLSRRARPETSRQGWRPTIGGDGRTLNGTRMAMAAL